MKKLFIIFTSILLSANMMAQSPHLFSYQSLVRDDSGQLVTEESIGVQFSILQGSIDGTAVYVETHTVVSNINGLITLAVGAGSTSYNFDEIDWLAGPYFLKTDMDPTGGINYSISGTTQLFSVPYALHAETAGNVFSGDYDDLINTPDLFSGDYDDLINAPDLSNFATKDMNSERITNLGNPVDEYDAVNRLFVTLSVSFTGDTLFLGTDQFVIIPGISGANHDDGMSVTDIDGNTYPITFINDRAWMAENLKTTRYNNGSSIPYIADHDEWQEQTTGAYCYYDNDDSWKDPYGALYNFHAVATEMLCPAGWRVPTMAEFEELADYLGGYLVAGSHLKSTRTAPDDDHPRWNNPNLGALDTYGFGSVPAGRRWQQGFQNFGQHHLMWTSTDEGSANPNAAHFFFTVFDYEYGMIFPVPTNKSMGTSIRCIKDED